MREIADRLIAYETKGNRTDTKRPAAFIVCEKLRPHLATLMGNAGFRALLSRALALANTDVPTLRGVHVKGDGALEGLDELAAQYGPTEMAESGLVLITELLGLLVAFIGEGLTVRLLREVWLKLSFETHHVVIGAKSEKTK
jgi:hypothetical protein